MAPVLAPLQDIQNAYSKVGACAFFDQCPISTNYILKYSVSCFSLVCSSEHNARAPEISAFSRYMVPATTTLRDHAIVKGTWPTAVIGLTLGQYAELRQLLES
jgi:hypothetical protein